MVSDRALLRLFFVSGMSGLLYEVLWIRMFTSVLGSSSQSVAAVVAAFMLGAGLGSFGFGRVADRLRSPLRLYGWLELGVALTAVVGFVVFFGSSDALQRWTASLAYDVVKWLQFGVAFAFVAAPAALLGGALPALARGVVREVEELRPRVGRLYAVNTMGAALGALGSIVLVAAWGYAWTYAVAVALTLVTGAMALWLGRGAARDRGAEPDTGLDTQEGPTVARAVEGAAPAAQGAEPAGLTDRPGHRWAPRTVLLVTFVAGLCALGYEVVWFRLVFFLLRGTLYGFALLLGVYLLGLGIGAGLASRPRVARNPARALMRSQAAIAVLGLAYYPLITLGYEATADRTQRLLITVGLLLTLTTVLGTALPLALRPYLSSLARTARGVGALYASNLAGALAGSLLVGFVLIPVLGTQTTASLLPLLNVLAVLALALVFRSAMPAVRERVLAGVVLAALAVAFYASDWTGRFVTAVNGGPGDELVALVESELQIVSVFEDSRGGRALFGGPFISGHTAIERRQTQKLQGHLPMLVHPDAQRVLVIGYGVGEIVRTVARYQPARIDVVEIDPEMIGVANDYFADLNERVSEQANVHVQIMDGRHFLHRTERQYDVIMSDSMFLESEMSMRLYTVEHFEAGRARLAPGGLMLCWLPTNIGGDASRTVVRTFAEVFPQMAIWVPDRVQAVEAFLLGFRDEVRVDVALVETHLAGVREDTALFGWSSAADVLRDMRFGPENVHVLWGARTRVNRDVRPVLDFQRPEDGAPLFNLPRSDSRPGGAP